MWQHYCRVHTTKSCCSSLFLWFPVHRLHSHWCAGLAVGIDITFRLLHGDYFLSGDGQTWHCWVAKWLHRSAHYHISSHIIYMIYEKHDYIFIYIYIIHVYRISDSKKYEGHRWPQYQYHSSAMLSQVSCRSNATHLESDSSVPHSLQTAQGKITRQELGISRLKWTTIDPSSNMFYTEITLCYTSTN